MARPGSSAIDSLSAVHILLVDDDPASREELVAVLRYCGALLLNAETDHDAVRTLDVIKPDIVIIAVPRRHRGDLAVVRLLRARKPEAGGVVPIVAVLHPGERLPADLGVTLQLTRPLDAWRLCGELTRLISKP